MVVLDPGHALSEEVSLTGTISRAVEMETSQPSAPIGATARIEVELEQSSKTPSPSSLQQKVVLPQARSSLVWGLLESLRRDPNPNPIPTCVEESQASQRREPGRDAPLEGEAYADCMSLLKLAGKTLTTLTVKAGRGQLKVKRLETDLAKGSYPPSFVPKAVTFGAASEEMQERWIALDRSFWKARTELAIRFKTELAEKQRLKVENHLNRTTTSLQKANCTELGLKKLKEQWDLVQTESVSLAQRQLEMAARFKEGIRYHLRKQVNNPLFLSQAERGVEKY